MALSRVGLLVSARTLSLARRGRSREKLALYDRAARRYGMKVIYFTPAGMDLKRRRVAGYVRTGRGYRGVTVPLPGVIYRRIIPTKARSQRLFRKLTRLPGVIVFNPPAQRNKLAVNRLLARNPAIGPSIPVTMPLRSASRALRFIQSQRTVYAKPATGSVGRGVYRIRAVAGAGGAGGYEVRSWRGTTRLLSADGMLRWLRARSGGGRYILQRGIDLAQHRGRPFDVRVTVQRDGQGAWRVTGMVAKVARAGSPVTNLGRGGRTITLSRALQEGLPPSLRAAGRRRLRQLALDVANELSRRWPRLADLGLDLALDHWGHPWFLEANLREQRPSFREAGGKKAAHRQYAMPMAYAAYLRRRRRSGRLGSDGGGTAESPSSTDQ